MGLVKHLTSNYVVPAGKLYETPPIDNSTFNKARITVSLGFNPDAISGMSMELWAYGSSIKRLLSMTPIDNTAITATSKTFDISHLNGFNIIFRNKCLLYDVEIGNSMITMWD